MTFALNRQTSTTSSAAPLTPSATKRNLAKGKGKKDQSIFKLFKKSIGRLIRGSSPKKGKKGSKAPKKGAKKGSKLIQLHEVRQFSRASGLGRLEAKVQSSGDEQDATDLEQQQRKLVTIKLKQSTQSLAVSRGKSAPMLNVSNRRQASSDSLLSTSSPNSIAKFVTKNVNQMKSQPLTLGEKLSRWCRQSPASIFKGCAPEDHFLPFPSVDYPDMEVNRRAEAELLSAIEGSDAQSGPTAADGRVEVVLERYAAGRHGLSPRTRPTATAEESAAAHKETTILLKEIKGRRSHARLHHLQAKMKKRESQASLVQQLAVHTQRASQPELKALQWMKDQQRRGNQRSGTTISMAAGVGSARDLSTCLGSTLDLNRIAALEQVAE